MCSEKHLRRAKGSGFAEGKGQREKGKGQRAKGKGQRAKGKGQRAKTRDEGKKRERGKTSPSFNPLTFVPRFCPLPFAPCPCQVHRSSIALRRARSPQPFPPRPSRAFCPSVP